MSREASAPARRSVAAITSVASSAIRQSIETKVGPGGLVAHPNVGGVVVDVDDVVVAARRVVDVVLVEFSPGSVVTVVVVISPCTSSNAPMSQRPPTGCGRDAPRRVGKE